MADKLFELMTVVVMVCVTILVVYLTSALVIGGAGCLMY